MSIILNERKWAEEALTAKELGRKPSETLVRIAKYYYDEGYQKQDVRNLLELFLTECDGSISPVSWSDTLDWATAAASRYPLVVLDGIPITKMEIETIRSMCAKQAGRLAFTLLCVSKYWDTVNPKNSHWVNEKDVELMKMANIHTSVRRQSLLFSQLRDAGLIRFSNKVDNLNVQVLFQDEEGAPVCMVRDFRNIGYQYLKEIGENYISCADCGLTIKAADGPGRKRKYCDDCMAARRRRSNVDSVMRLRGKIPDKS